MKCSQHRCLVMLGTREGSIVHKGGNVYQYCDTCQKFFLQWTETVDRATALAAMKEHGNA